MDNRTAAIYLIPNLILFYNARACKKLGQLIIAARRVVLKKILKPNTASDGNTYININTRVGNGIMCIYLSLCCHERFISKTNKKQFRYNDVVCKQYFERICISYFNHIILSKTCYFLNNLLRSTSFP